MALSNFQGPANDVGILPHLVGDTIVGAFEDETHLYLVFSSGPALVLTSFGGHDGPSMWKEEPKDFQKVIRRLKSELEITKAGIEQLIAASPIEPEQAQKPPAKSGAKAKVQ